MPGGGPDPRDVVSRPTVRLGGPPERRGAPACEGCGAPFRAPPSALARGRRYCSRACYAAAGRVTAVCPECGATFGTIRSEPRRFCSAGCYGVALARGDFRPRSPKPSWPRCADCGDPDGYRNPRGRTPVRKCGTRFGVAGPLCARCWNRRYMAAQRRGHLTSVRC
jgi:hypothetical protein